MRFRNSIASSAGLIALALLVVTGPMIASDDVTADVALRWALGALEVDDAEPSAIKHDTQLAAGARLKFLVEPLSPSSVYLVLLDSDEAIHLLYRESTKVEHDGEGKPTYIPPGTQWFELDDSTGLETFFLLAAAEPLTELDRLLDAHEKADAAAQKADAAAQKAMVGDIVEEMRRLQKAHRRFARPVEKPVMIGGRTRGTTDASAIDQLAVEVSAETFYAKTITIDH